MTDRGNTLTGPYGNSRDAVAHEFGHAIANSLFDPWGLDWSDGQSAAIDEGFADVNAALVDAWYQKDHVPNDPVTWTIAEVYPGDETKGLRSMKDPKSMDPDSRDWFPARQLGPSPVTRHNNATIMSHAFKLMANQPSPAPGAPGGGYHVRAGQPIIDSNVPGNIPSLFVAGLGPTKTWNVFVHTFDNPLIDPFVTLPKVKEIAKSEATLLYGAANADVVDRAFLAVGVGHNCTAPPQAPQLQVAHWCPKWRLSWPAVPGATIYHGEMNPVVFQWLNPVTIVDGNVNQCTQRVYADYHAHVRACNGCGCSPWSNEVFMNYWPQCP